MISHGKDIKVFTGNSNPALAKEICQVIGTKLGESEVKTFADGEVSVSLYETVRGSDVFLINSTCKPVNDSLMFDDRFMSSFQNIADKTFRGLFRNISLALVAYTSDFLYFTNHFIVIFHINNFYTGFCYIHDSSPFCSSIS